MNFQRIYLVGILNLVLIQLAFGSCVKKCTAGGVNLKYEPGKSYIYNFKIASGQDKAQLVMSGDALILPTTGCEHTLKLSNVKVEGTDDYTKAKQELEARNMIYSFEDGSIRSMCPTNGDNEFTVVTKKVLLSAFQVGAVDELGEEVFYESDVNGNCETTYNFQGSTPEGIRMIKSKASNTCSGRDKHSYLAQKLSKNTPGSYICEILVQNKLVKRSKCVTQYIGIPSRKQTVELALKDVILPA